MSGRLRDRFLPSVVSSVGPLLVRSLGCTWRVGWEGIRTVQQRQEGSAQRYIFSFWHSTLLPLMYLHRGEGITALVSRHGDGELITRVCLKMGVKIARGSTTEGGATGMRELLRATREGDGDLAITPDGPKGPAKKAQPGLFYLSGLSGLPILPITMAADRAWRFRSWDRFQVPKLFARVSVVTGHPISVPRENLEGRIGEFQAEYEKEMARIEEVARKNLGMSPESPSGVTEEGATSTLEGRD